MRLLRKPGVWLGLLTLAGCVPGESWSGTLTYINTEVVFARTDGSPLSGESVFIAETIGAQVIVTESRQADADGVVHLEGRYCAPVMVGVDGGHADIRAGAMQPRYTITVTNDRSPKFSRLFTSMPTDIASLKQSRRYLDCAS